MKHIRSLILASALFASLAPAFAQAPPPVPALPDTERRTSYSISASTCACNVGFALYGDSTDYTNWIEVWVNGARITQAGNWTITSPTGSLATIPRPITDAVLTFTAAQTGTVQIVGAQRPRRTSQFTENRGVAARDLNQVITSLTAQLRENWDKTNDVTGRAVIAPPGETLAMLPKLANRLSQGACFDSSGNLTTCVSIPSSTFAAGAGITLSGVGPTTIAANLSAALPIVMSGTAPIQFSCPTCGTVTGPGSSVSGNVPQFSNTGGTALADTGNPSVAMAQARGLIPAATPQANTFTVTIAAPAVVTQAGYTPQPNDVWTPTTTGALPTGLTASTSYFVVGSSISGSTFSIATSIANAKAGTKITTTGSQSGTHTGSVNTVIPAGFKGHIDEITVIAGSAVGIPFRTATAVTSLAQAAGIYDCSGELIGTTGSGQIASEYHGAITTTVPPALQGLPASGGGNGDHIIYIVNNSAVFNFGPRRFVFTSPTTVYLALYSSFGTDATGFNGLGGNIAGYGYLRCETK